jgi:branched-chain amino acid transport system substrate-binding protein
MTRGWKRLGLVALAAAGVGAIAVATAAATVSRDTGTEAATKSPVKVGIIYTRTGLLSAYGAEYIEGLRLGLEYVTHGTNSVNGHKIQLTIVDDKFDAATAVSAAKDLIGKGYKIIAGSVGSGIALSVAPLAAQNNVLFISGPAATDAITGNNRNTFRSGRQSIQDVLAAAAFLRGQVGRKVLVLAQDSAFGQGNVAAVKAYIGGKGHNVDSILVPQNATDFTPFAQQARRANADLLFVAWAGTTADAMWRALDQQGVLDSTQVVTGLAERATWSSYGDPATARKIKFLSHYVWTAPKNKVNDWLVAKMKRRSQRPDLFTPDGFVAAQMIARAVGKADGDDVTKMIRALEGWQFVGPKGVERIRQQDHAMNQPMFQVQLTYPNGPTRPVAKVLKTISPAIVQPPVRPFP